MSASAIEAALAAARAFCVTVDGRNDLSLDGFLEAVHRDVTALYAAMLSLPEVEPSDTEYEGRSYDDWKALYEDLKVFLGRVDLYREVYHPYEEDSEPPVVGSLADAIADVYGAARRSLRIADEGSRIDAAWELQFGFEVDAGHQALDAMRAIHMHRFDPLFEVDGSRATPGSDSEA